MPRARLSLIPEYRKPSGPQPVEIPIHNTVKVGRYQHPDFADIALVSTSVPSMVSRKHCQIDMRDGVWHILDFNSLNGVLRNGTQVTQNAFCPIKDQDRITFGTEESDMVYIFQVIHSSRPHVMDLAPATPSPPPPILAPPSPSSGPSPYPGGIQAIPLRSADLERLKKAHKRGFLNDQQLEQRKQQAAKRMDWNYDPSRVPRSVNEIPGLSPAETYRTEKGFKYTYCFKTQKWQKKIIILTMEQHPFDEGNMRQCYHMKDLTQPPGRQKMVAKLSKRGDPPSTYFADVQMQALCMHFAEEYNKFDPPKAVKFVEASLVELFERPASHGHAHPLVACEPFMSGQYKKHNNNWGFVGPEDRNTPQAFSHFTFNLSQKKYLVCDIQGVSLDGCDYYTDPQVHSNKDKPRGEFGGGNMGKEGINKFFQTHQCNYICEYIGLCDAAHRRKRHDRGTCPPRRQVAMGHPSPSAPRTTPPPSQNQVYDNNYDLSPEELQKYNLKDMQLRQLVAAFKAADKSNTGGIDRPEMVTLCQTLGVDLGPNLDRLDFFMTKADKDGLGQISFREFLDWWVGGG